MIQYGFKKEVAGTVKETEEIVTGLLKKHGFGVLTRIDLGEKFREKLNVDYRDYVILGACNPPHAYQSVLAEEDIGLMLPCNVIIYEKGAKSIVSIIKPTAAMGMISNPKLTEEAEKVEEILKSVFESL